MTDFLLELRSEEIPARMQAGARASLDKLFREQMTAAGFSGVMNFTLDFTIWSTPRRLALVARDLPDATEAIIEEVKGPRANAPTQAIDGFLNKHRLSFSELIERGGVLYAVSQKPGRATKDVLAEAIPAIVRAFPWPKSMRWGAASLSAESLRWVRPLSGIVAILGEELVECEVGGIRSGYATKGHRFHAPGEITIGGAHDYADKLRACHVIVDHEERQSLIRDKAHAAAQAAGLTLVADEGLVIENAGLTEWPVPLLGWFEGAFLEVPPEVIQLTARTNQKYFVCEQNGKLANAFVCTANIEAADGGEAIVAGNRKVLAARLSDARFFWEQDRKTPLAEQAKKLERITFHEKLGTVADKVERVAKLARWLVEEGIVGNSSPARGGGPAASADGGGGSPPAQRPADNPLHRPADGPPPRAGEDLADLAEQAARLCKADLVTEMVGEFPELQGLMGGYYARAEGVGGEHTDAVADAIRDHYKPVGQGDEVPTAPVTVAVSLADKLDTLLAFFGVDLRPTGSKDPFALRRAALGIIAIVCKNNLRFPMAGLIAYQLSSFRLWSFGQINLGEVPSFDDYGDKNYDLEQINDNLVLTYGGKEIAKWAASITPSLDRFRFIASIEDADVAAWDFLADRLKVQQKEAGVRHDLIDAVFALGGEDDLVRLLARVHALQAFVGTEDGANLLAGYKRAANILRKEDHQSVTPAKAGVHSASGVEGEMDSGPRRNDGNGDGIPRTGEEDPLAQVDDPDLAPVIAAKLAERRGNPLSYTPEPAEKALIDSLDLAQPQAARAVETEDFAGAMAALASLRPAVDAFFDNVTVNDADADKRQARLELLARFRDAVHGVADFSKIEG